MKRKLFLILLLVIPALVLLAPIPGMAMATQRRTRGKKTGAYTLSVVGDFKGTGSLSVTDTTITIALNLTYPSGASSSLSFNSLPLSNDRFSGTASGGTGVMSMTGRVDLPSANDDQETDEQVFTGRVVATLRDAGGKSARLVAIQEESSKGGKTNGNNGNGNGGGNGNGNGH